MAVAGAEAMNGVKNEAIIFHRRRGWAEPLDASLDANGVDRRTFEAMNAAVVDALPGFRRYLRAKARLLGSGGIDGGLPWWDLAAPVGDGSLAIVPWPAACTLVLDTFASYSPALAAVARRAFEGRWIDTEAREGKRAGGFTMPMRGDESRILMNFTPSPDGACTLAHELGHAYHTVQLAPRTALQREPPMTLDETASIFCETLLRKEALARADAVTIPARGSRCSTRTSSLPYR